MSVLVTVEDFRRWAGASVATVPDDLIAGCLDEAEAGLLIDVDSPMADVQADPAAVALATGEELRRASRLLARRNSPEAVAGFGDAVFQVPVRDPDSYRTVSAIRSVLLADEGVA